MKKSPVHCIHKSAINKLCFMVLLIQISLMTFSGCDYFFPPISGDKISPEEAEKYISRHKKDNELVLLDINTKGEFDSVSIEGSLNLDFTLPDFPEMIQKLNKEKRYIIFDMTGKKSAMAFELMKEERFSKVHYVSGGITEWQKKNLQFLLKKK